jgi:hypothetical protein
MIKSTKHAVFYDPRMFWNTTKKIIFNKPGHGSLAELLLCIDGQIVSEPSIVSNHMNGFFVNIVDGISNRSRPGNSVGPTSENSNI